MRALPLSLAIHLHDLSRSVVPNYYRAEHALFREFYRESTRLQAMIGDLSRDSDWRDLMGSIRRYRFRLSTCPVPFNHPAVAPRLQSAEMLRIVGSLSRSYPTYAVALRGVVERLIELQQCSDSPLLDLLVRSVDRESASGAVIIRESRLALVVQEAVDSGAIPGAWQVITPAGILDTVEGGAFVVGPAALFPDHLFAAPRFSWLFVVSFDWNSKPWRRSPAFVSGFSPLGSKQSDSELKPVGDPDYFTPELDWMEIQSHWLTHGFAGTGGDSADALDARFYLLQGGLGVFLEATGRKTTMIIDLQGEDHSRVRQVADAEIEEGMFVVLRTSGGGDYIAPLADRILGAAAPEFRSVQQRWKVSLRGLVAEHGLLAISVRLLDLDSRRADETNLRFWMSDRNIAPRAKEDFSAIMRLVGYEDHTDEYWRMARAIRAAHLRAGAMIRRRLIELVRAADEERLVGEGRLDFELPEAEGGKLTAYRVETRSPTTVSVSPSRIEHPFMAD